LSDGIGDLNALEYLDVAFNNIKTISSKIGQLSSLRVLIVNDNALVSIPQSVGNLSALQLLNVQYNQLVSLPHSLGNLESLKDLVISGTRYGRKVCHVFCVCVSGGEMLLFAQVLKFVIRLAINPFYKLLA
jgi:hypothetical protein